VRASSHARRENESIDFGRKKNERIIFQRRETCDTVRASGAQPMYVCVCLSTWFFFFSF
jgi:hypothetical protein